MNIRAITLKDIEILKDLHYRFYKDEFEFPDFLNNFLSSFVVTDDNDKIIIGGGVRLITESVIVTDKNYPIKDRRLALLEILRASMFTAARENYNELHAFVQDDKWMRHLKTHGFRDTKGKALVINL